MGTALPRGPEHRHDQLAHRGVLAESFPRAAVQTIGGCQVVFVAVPHEGERFSQHTVTLGSLVGEAYTVLQGLQPGEVVVTKGGFFLRAESLRNAPSS